MLIFSYFIFGKIFLFCFLQTYLIHRFGILLFSRLNDNILSHCRFDLCIHLYFSFTNCLLFYANEISLLLAFTCMNESSTSQCNKECNPYDPWLPNLHTCMSAYVSKLSITSNKISCLISFLGVHISSNCWKN